MRNAFPRTSASFGFAVVIRELEEMTEDVPAEQLHKPHVAPPG